jgi:nucleotide-binding universal stress UspA family protein
MRGAGRSQSIGAAQMGAQVIISYDGTANDDDAVALGKLLARDTIPVLAYVRHAPEYDPEREELARHDAEQRLEQGAEQFGDADIPRHVVFSASTGAGLEELAQAEGASLIVFGSDYRTPPGHAEPPTSAQRLLEVGAIAIAVASAGLRSEPPASIGTIAVLGSDGDRAAAESADALAASFGARVLEGAVPAADLIVVGSQAGAPAGRLALSGAARTMLDASRGSVLVVPSGRPVSL